jgi:hypothetical protein
MNSTPVETSAVLVKPLMGVLSCHFLEIANDWRNLDLGAK